MSIVNELSNISNQFTSCLFADDTTLIFKSSSKYDLFRDCDFGVNLFYSWCCANRLSINISKTKSMLFSNTLTPLEIADVYMNHIKIEYTSSIRFLGVIFDDKLKFNVHINEISKKISKNIGVLYKLKQYVPRNTLVSIYRSIIECHLNYSIIIFGNTSSIHLSPMVTAQKKAVRIVASQPPLSHSDPIFSNLKLLKVSDLYLYNLGIFMRKNLTYFSQNYVINLYNTRSGDRYVPSRQRLTQTLDQSIMYQAPHNWSNIPVLVKNSPSLKSFKINYKHFLISQYQNSSLSHNP